MFVLPVNIERGHSIVQPNVLTHRAVIRRAGRAAFALAIVTSLVTALACSKGPQGPMQFPPTQVTTVTVAPQTIAAHYRYQGIARSSKHIIVRAQVAGVVIARPFVEGSDVAKGTLLYEIDTTQYAAALRNAMGTLDDAKAKLANANINLNRVKPLLAERAVAQSTVDSAEQILRQAEADVAGSEGAVDQARKSYTDCFVRAEVSGRVGLAYLVLGSRVTGSSDSLTTLDQIDPLYVEFNPSDQDLLEWRREIAAKRLSFPSGKLRVRVYLADGSVVEQPGTLNFADISIQSQTGTETLRATFPNAGHIILPGQFVKVELLDLKRDGALLVPQRAVQQGLAGSYVYVVGDSNKVGIRPVQASSWSGAQWVIDNGIKPGDKVIVDGTQKIYPGAQVKPVDYKPAADSGAPPPTAGDVPASPAFPLVSGR
jgi:membrane fusion protein (multidrug efflux system)